MSNKNFAISVLVISVTIVACIVFVMFASVTMQGINAPATLAAIVIAIIGIVWMRKTGVKR